MIVVSLTAIAVASLLSSGPSLGGLHVLVPRDQAGVQVRTDGIGSGIDGWSILQPCDTGEADAHGARDFHSGSVFGAINDCRRADPLTSRPPFELYLLGTESSHTLLHLVGDDIVCTHLDARRGVWFVWDDEGGSPGVPCEPVSLRGGKRLTIDSNVLSGTGSSIRSISDRTQSNPTSVTLQYCDRLHEILVGASPSGHNGAAASQQRLASFVTLTGASSTYQQQSLWLDYCDISPTQVQLRDDEVMVPPLELASVDSMCSVRRVVGLEAYAAGFYNLTQDDIFACLEEVMDVLNAVQQRRSDDSGAGHGSGALVYMSALGLSPFPGTQLSDGFVRDAAEDYSRVMRAYFMAESRHLVIASTSLRNSVPLDEINLSFVDDLADAATLAVVIEPSDLERGMMEFSNALASPMTRRQVVRRLHHVLSERHYVKAFDPPRTDAARLAARHLMASLLHYAANDNESSFSGSSWMRTAAKDVEVSSDFLAGLGAGDEERAVQVLRLVDVELINILDTLLLGQLAGCGGSYDKIGVVFPVASSFVMESYFKSVSTNDFKHVSGSISRGDCMPRSMKQSEPDIDILMVYVLIFVTGDELEETQHYVQAWKRREMLRSNLYLRYYTIRTPDVDSDYSLGERHEYVGRHLRFSLLSAKRIMLDSAGKLDAVIVLNGLGAVRSFVAPHPDPAQDTGIMPFPFEIDPVRKVRLSAPMVFSGRGGPLASSSSEGALDDRVRSECLVLCHTAFHTAQCPCSDVPLIDSRGFASTVSQLFDMMDFLEAHTPGFHRGSVADTGDDLAVHRALQMYACSRPWDVDVDREGRFFGPVGIPREVAAAPPMSKASLESGLFAELDDAALESIRYCDLNYAAERLGPLIACNSPSECYVNMTEAQEMERQLFDMLAELPVQLCKGVGLSYTAYLLIQSSNLLHVPLSRLNWIVTVFPMMAYNVTLAEKLTLVHAMSSELQRVESLMQTDADSSAFSANDVFRNHIRSLHLILSGVYQEIGPLQSALQYYHRSLLAVDYRTHRSERDLWKQRRKLYANSAVVAARASDKSASASVVPKVHIYTIATHHSPKLDALNFSARIAGFELKLAGFGLPWGGLRCKYPYYRDAIALDDTIDDDDILFLIDAYDTVMFPAFRQFPKLLSNLPSPMLMCSENALYPEQLAAMSYPRGTRDSRVRFGHYFRNGSLAEHSIGLSRFGNTGCMGGRAADVKRFLKIDEIWPHETYSDDQMSGTRFAQGFPHVTTVDSERIFFYSAYREIAGMNVNFDAMIKFESNLLPSVHNIGLLHCNGGSLAACDSAVQLLRSFHSTYFSGPEDGELLLEAVRALWDGDLARAQRMLLHPAVQANASHNVLAGQLIRGFASVK